jgi:hypothetical protein
VSILNQANNAMPTIASTEALFNVIIPSTGSTIQLFSSRE